ncbi:hypothetical protein ACWCOZ_04795 [Streptomyces sp. NPDC001840]|uniref:hypothetical protein n=1 Tax=Streptomyces sp. NPDC059396 TaxID=3346819 RepID=UPI003694B010
MSVWHGAKARRAAGAALAVVVLSVSLSACGGGDGGTKEGASSSSSAPGDDKPKEENGPTVPDTSKTLVTIDGANGFQFLIHSAERDGGGFLTVNGTIKNVSGKRQAPRIAWSGQETQVQRTGRSLAGITLVDRAEKKRYYVLRDTEGYPLTTTGIDAFDDGESVTFFAQFPAPPDATSQVDIQIPGATSATIEIS